MSFPILACLGPLSSVYIHMGHGTVFSGGYGFNPDTSTPSLLMALQEDGDIVKETVRVCLKSMPSAWHWRWIPGDVSPPGKMEGLRPSCTGLHPISISLPQGCKHMQGAVKMGERPLPGLYEVSGVCLTDGKTKAQTKKGARPGPHSNHPSPEPWAAGPSNMSRSSHRWACCVKGSIAPP